MLSSTVNLIFATVFALLAWWSVPRGWNFFKVGWTALQEQTKQNSEDKNTGLYFFLAGLAWLIGGIFSAIIAIALSILTIIQLANS